MGQFWLPGDSDFALALRGFGAPNAVPGIPLSQNGQTVFCVTCGYSGSPVEKVNLVDNVLPAQDGTILAGSSRGGLAADFTSQIREIFTGMMNI